MTRQTQLVASLGIAILLGSFLLPVGATAQTGLGGVSGVVRDTTGGVLPGVTVEVSSPALIEGVRIAITDGEGRYGITELRPGTYTVSFSLVGFSVVRREGLELRAGFTANVNADMAVGSLEETITVTGESPVVDIQNVRTQNTFSRDESGQDTGDEIRRGLCVDHLRRHVGANPEPVGGRRSERSALELGVFDPRRSAG